jgi:hypothetical protein
VKTSRWEHWQINSFRIRLLKSLRILGVKLSAHPVKTGQARQGLPGNVDMIIGSALTPVLESVTALPAPAYRQEDGASSRLAREHGGKRMGYRILANKNLQYDNCRVASRKDANVTPDERLLNCNYWDYHLVYYPRFY